MAKKNKKKKKRTDGFTAHTIRIEVKNGAFTYTHSPGGDDGESVQVHAGDTVKWKGPKHALAILFSSGSPFSEVVFGAPKGGSSRPSTVLGVEGKFKYAVLAADGSSLDTDDPDIIVT